MSFGLICLTCRRYIVGKSEPDYDATFHCVCKTPRPSWDGKTEVKP